MDSIHISSTAHSIAHSTHTCTYTHSTHACTRTHSIQHSTQYTHMHIYIDTVHSIAHSTHGIHNTHTHTVHTEGIPSYEATEAVASVEKLTSRSEQHHRHFLESEILQTCTHTCTHTHVQYRWGGGAVKSLIGRGWGVAGRQRWSGLIPGCCCSIILPCISCSRSSAGRTSSQTMVHFLDLISMLFQSIILVGNKVL